MARFTAIDKEGPSIDVSSDQRIEEGKAIIGKVSKLKYEMVRDRELQYVHLSNHTEEMNN